MYLMSWLKCRNEIRVTLKYREKNTCYVPLEFNNANKQVIALSRLL
jgi:hypothetical protein